MHCMTATSPAGTMDKFETAISKRVHLDWTPLCPGNTNQLHCDSSTISIPQGGLQGGVCTGKWKKLQRGLELMEQKLELSLVYLTT